MNGRLLIPLNGSARAVRVLSMLDQWVNPAAELILLHVRPQPSNGCYAGELEQLIDPKWQAPMAASLRYLEQASRPLRRRGWKISHTVRFGDPVEQIEAVALAERASVVIFSSVMPSRLGPLGDEDLSARLAARARVPLMVYYCPALIWISRPRPRGPGLPSEKW